MNRLSLHGVSAVEIEHKCRNGTYWTDFTFTTREGVQFEVTAFTNDHDTLKEVSDGS